MIKRLNTENETFKGNFKSLAKLNIDCSWFLCLMVSCGRGEEGTGMSNSNRYPDYSSIINDGYKSVFFWMKIKCLREYTLEFSDIQKIRYICLLLSEKKLKGTDVNLTYQSRHKQNSPFNITLKSFKSL